MSPSHEVTAEMECALPLIRAAAGRTFFAEIKRRTGRDLRPLVCDVAMRAVTECPDTIPPAQALRYNLFASEIIWLNICLERTTPDQLEIDFSVKNVIRLADAVAKPADVLESDHSANGGRKEYLDVIVGVMMI